MTLSSEDIAYFNRMGSENEKFLRRLPPLANAKPGYSVLDVGCGHGRLCVDLAQRGAGRVVGVDLDAERVGFGVQNIQENFPELADTVSLHCIDLAQFDPAPQFDFIVSKDSFEHIMDLGGMLREIYRRLVPGGKLCFGFGPLYNSAYGGHGRLKVLSPIPHFPWFHLIVPESILLRRVNLRREPPVESIQDLGLNQLSLKGYRRLFDESDFTIDSMTINCSERWLSKLFSAARRLPLLEEYFSHNIYAVFTKPH